MPQLGLGLGLHRANRALFRGLLDQYAGAAAAYSLRALSSGWLAGDVVEVRPSSGAAAQGFTASQITSGAMLSFVNGGTTDLYNSARYFNGTSTTVTLGSTVTMAGDFSISLSHLYVGTGTTSDLIGDNTINSRFGYSVGLSAYFIATTSGTLTFSGSMPNEGEINVIEINRVGTTITLTLNGSDFVGTLGGTLNINRISSFAAQNYSKGFTYAINLNGQAAYTGLGTSVTAWEDTIGSNDGTEANGAAYTGQPFDGFVSTWYDQSGNGNDATQPTTTEQPKIVNAGALVTDSNGRASVQFDGGVGDDDGLLATIGAIAQPFTAFSVSEVFALSHSGGIWGTTSPAVIDFYRNTGKHAINAGASVENGAYSINTSYVKTSIFNGASSSIAINGSNTTGLAAGSGAIADSIYIGRYSVSGTTLDGIVSELIIYSEDKLSDRVGIETIMNNYYGAF
jgi:hypothetical protein